MEVRREREGERREERGRGGCRVGGEDIWRGGRGGGKVGEEGGSGEYRKGGGGEKEDLSGRGLK